MNTTSRFNTIPRYEPCVRPWHDNNIFAIKAEANILVKQLYRQFDQFDDLHINIIDMKCGFDKFALLEITTNTETTMRIITDEFPEYWDNTAINELLNNEFVVEYYEVFNPDHLQSLRLRLQDNSE